MPSCVCMVVCLFCVCLYAKLAILVYVCVVLSVSVHVCMRVCVYVCMNVCKYVSIYTCQCLCGCVYVYVLLHAGIAWGHHCLYVCVAGWRATSVCMHDAL